MFLNGLHFRINKMSQRFEIQSEARKGYRRFNAVGRQLTVRLNPSSETNTNPVNHFLASVNDLFERALQNVSDSDRIGVAVHNEVNQSDRPIGPSFRRKNHLYGDTIWSVFEKVAQSNSRFNVLDRLVVVVHSVRMPVGFGSIKTKGGKPSVMANI